MNRQQALAIFNTMDDDKLFQALDAVGIPADDGMGKRDLRQEDTLEPWSAQNLALGQGSGGMFLDRSRFATPMPQAQRRANPEPDYKKFSPTGYEDYAAFDPGVEQ